MSEDFPNKHQVDLCYKRTHDKYFSGFQEEIKNYRLSNELNMETCLKKGGNDIGAATGCIQNYLFAIRRDNDKLAELFREKYSKV